MNKKIRFTCLSLLAALTFTQAANAEPQTYGPRNSVRFESLPAQTAALSCGPVIKEAWYGPRRGAAIVGNKSPCLASEPMRRPMRWAGPRNSVPIYG